MMLHLKEPKDEEQSGIQLYTRRWAFLFGFVIMQIFAGVSFTSFGHISSFYVQFFNASHSEVDWITNARNVGGVFVIPVLVWFMFTGHVRLRFMLLLVSVCSTLGLLLVTISLTRRSFIMVILAGQLMSGLSETFGIAVPSILAVLWFPEHEVGTAIALSCLGYSIGDVTGDVFPPNLVYSSWNDSNATSLLLSSDSMRHGQRSLIIFYGTLFLISAITTGMFFAFAADKPPTPPTRAQALKNDLHCSKRTLRVFLDDTKALFTNWSYVLTCLVAGICLQIFLIESMFLAQIIRFIRRSLFPKLYPGITSGYVASVYSFSGGFGTLACGKIVDRYKNYKLLAIINVAMMAIATGAFAVGFVVKSVAMLFTFNAMFGFFSFASLVVLLEMVTQQTYPVDETIASTWMTEAQSLVAVCFGVIGRIVFNLWGALAVLIFQCLCCCLGVVLLLFVQQTNKRLEIIEKPVSNGNGHEGTPLIRN